MGRLVAIEGLDGAGKDTLAGALARQLADRGLDVERIAFPRYGVDAHADLIDDALRGRLGDLPDSVYGMAVLFALDRRAAVPALATMTARHDVVLCDRYVASNAAYGAARLGQDATGSFVAWLAELELRRFEVPVPDVQLLLRTPLMLAAARASERAGREPARAPDAYETNEGLQRRCAEVYEQLAAAEWVSSWLVVDGDAPCPATVAERLIG